jgi:hypothetical protein
VRHYQDPVLKQLLLWQPNPELTHKTLSRPRVQRSRKTKARVHLGAGASSERKGGPEGEETSASSSKEAAEKELVSEWQSKGGSGPAKAAKETGVKDGSLSREDDFLGMMDEIDQRIQRAGKSGTDVLEATKALTRAEPKGGCSVSARTQERERESQELADLAPEWKPTPIQSSPARIGNATAGADNARGTSMGSPAREERVKVALDSAATASAEKTKQLRARLEAARASRVGAEERSTFDASGDGFTQSYVVMRSGVVATEQHRILAKAATERFMSRSLSDFQQDDFADGGDHGGASPTKHAPPDGLRSVLFRYGSWYCAQFHSSSHSLARSFTFSFLRSSPLHERLTPAPNPKSRCYTGGVWLGAAPIGLESVQGTIPKLQKQQHLLKYSYPVDKLPNNSPFAQAMRQQQTLIPLVEQQVCKCPTPSRTAIAEH